MEETTTLQEQRKKELRAWLYSQGVKALKITDEGIEAIEEWRKYSNRNKFLGLISTVGSLTIGWLIGTYL